MGLAIHPSTSKISFAHGDCWLPSESTPIIVDLGKRHQRTGSEKFSEAAARQKGCQPAVKAADCLAGVTCPLKHSEVALFGRQIEVAVDKANGS